MCVIAFSPKGVDIPTELQLKQMWRHNPDGAGYAYVGRGGKVVYKKGFMTLDSLLDELSDRDKFKNTNFAIHFRIGTSGENDRKTCHPFPLSTNFGDLRKTEGEVESVLFHNGIISSGGMASPLSSDTQDFVIAMTPLLYKYNRSKTRDYFIEELTKNNRLLILYKNNAFKMYGEWKKDGDIWVSNTLYKDYYSWSGDDYDKDMWRAGWWDDWYEDYRYSIKTPDTDDKKNISDSNTFRSDSGKTYTEEKVIAMLNEILEKQYRFVTSDEINALVYFSNAYTEPCIDNYGRIYYDDMVIGFDEMGGVAWLDYSPEEYRSRKEEEQGVVEND